MAKFTIVQQHNRKGKPVREHVRRVKGGASKSTVSPEDFTKDSVIKQKMYHQTSAANVESIKENGFDINKGKARLSDEGTPDGVFFKPDQQDIGLSEYGEDPSHVEVYLKMEKPLVVQNRDELIRVVKNGSDEYASAKREHDLYDRHEMSENNKIEREYD